MDENQDALGEYHPEWTQEDERHEAEFQEMIRTHLEAGWTWNASKTRLTHPSDPRIVRCFDPYTHEEYLSPAEIEALKRELERQRRGGES